MYTAKDCDGNKSYLFIITFKLQYKEILKLVTEINIHICIFCLKIAQIFISKFSLAV